MINRLEYIQNKMFHKLWNILYLITTLVRSLDKRWNQFIPSVYLLAKRLESLGCEYHNGIVTYVDFEEENDV